jgi:site-specific recombinase XerD
VSAVELIPIRHLTSVPNAGELSLRSAAPPAPVPPADGRLERLLAGWLLAYNSPHTRRAYARDLSGWVGWCAQLEVDPLQAGRVHVDAWARHLTEQRQLAPATVARRLAAVSAFYRWCVLEQHLPGNPAVHVRRPEVDPDASTTFGLTGEQARALLAAAADHSPRMRALVALLLVDGLRISEALALDIDHVRGVDRGHRVAQLRRKGGRTARAALPPLVADAIDTYLAHRAAHSDGAGHQHLAGPLFVTRTGARWRPGNAARALTALARRAGIPTADRVTPHALRHAAITLALDAGVPLHEVQDFAGHRDPRSTRRYDRARGRLDRHASYALAAHLA